MARIKRKDCPCTFELCENGRFVSSFIAYLKQGRIHRTLEIPSYPAAPSAALIAPVLLDFCQVNRISTAFLSTFAAPISPPDCWPCWSTAVSRSEYIIHLDKDHRACFSKPHLRNINKAQKAGVVLDIGSSSEHCAQHLALCRRAAERRVDGSKQLEPVLTAGDFMPFVAEKAGIFVRAVQGSEVLASAFLLLAPKGAYYYSAGGSDEGRSLGAAHFLIARCADYLKERGCVTFNLGGTTANQQGLARFKKEFGGQEIALKLITLHFPSPLNLLKNGMQSLAEKAFGFEMNWRQREPSSRSSFSAASQFSKSRPSGQP